MRVELELDAEPGSVVRARAFVVTALGGVGLDQVCEIAALLVGELATNAVVHARSDYRVAVDTRTGGAMVEVWDRSPVTPVRLQPGPDAERGRGLAMLDALSSRWGVRQDAHGKCVWFALRAVASGRHRPVAPIGGRVPSSG